MGEAGDYDKKGADFETILVGPVTPLIVDAARFVREGYRGEPGWDNGFPNWAMYRVAMAGDSHLRKPLRDWIVAYAIAHCEAGGVRAGMPADEIGCLAGWDAFYRLLNHRWVIAGQDVADVAGVDPKTFRKVRDRVYGTLALSMRDYFMRLEIAIRQVVQHDRWIHVERVDRWRPTDTGPHEKCLTDGQGNYLALPLRP